MPGMMDTVLNLGLNDEVAAGLAAKSGERFAYDSFRRFLDMFGNVVSISFLASGLLLPATAAELTPTQHVVGSISVRFVSFARIASTAHP